MSRVLIAVLVALVLPAAAAPAQEAAGPARLSVEGTGQVSLAPDMASVTLGVVTEGDSAAAALAANSARMERALAGLAAAGIAERDIRTTRIDLSPRWTRGTGSLGQAPRIDGFTAANAVEVRVRDLDALGAVVRAGANDIRGIRFGLADETAALDRARELAVADARRKAALYAAAAGLTLGPVIEMAEQGAAEPWPRPMMEASMAADAAPVPVAGGEMTVSARIGMVFALAE
jgi:uncharacterized protein YggE